MPGSGAAAGAAEAEAAAAAAAAAEAAASAAAAALLSSAHACLQCPPDRKKSRSGGAWTSAWSTEET